MNTRTTPPAQARRRRAQLGMTMVETLLAMSLSAMVFVPIIGFAQFALREEGNTQQRSISSSGLGNLRTILLRDVASADSAATSGAGLVDCAGGDGAGGAPVLVLASGTERVVYSRASGSEGGTALWRRACATPGGATSGSFEVITGLLQSGALAECRTAGPTVGSCRRVTLRVSTSDARTASVTASVRSDGPAVGAGTGGSALQAPVVALAATPTSGGRGTTVRFSSAGSAAVNGSPLAFAWEFGDGTTSDQAAPTKQYTTIGRFTVVLTVTDAAGTPSTDFVVVDITNRAPEAVISSPEDGLTVRRGQVVEFSSDGSNDDEDASSGGRIVSYLWEFGDGTSSTDAEPLKAFSALSPTAGFTVRLTVADDLGATNQAQVKVIVVNRVPTVSITATPPSGAPPLAVTLTAAVVDEPDLGASAPPVTYAWDLGDGTTSTVASPQVTYNSTGTRTVRLTVTDDVGETATATTTVLVTRLPVAAFTATPAIGRAPFTVTFANTTSDPDGNATSWSWDFGDGGSSTARAPGTRSYTFNNASSDTFAGATYAVRLNVRDRFGNTTTATQNVVVNGSPVPAGLRASRSGTTVTYRWTAATPNVNGYQVNVDFPGACTDRVFTITSGTATSQAFNYGGTTGTTCARQTQNITIRSRDSVTGKWGAWSSTVRFN